MMLALIPGLGTVGPTELLILLTIILLLFGAKRIPELAKGLGSGVREFKKGTSGEGEKDEVKGEKEKKGRHSQVGAARTAPVRRKRPTARSMWMSAAPVSASANEWSKARSAPSKTSKSQIT
jgi:sec-independent protein translocase protein TatA